MIVFEDYQSILGALTLHSVFTPKVLTDEQFSAEMKLYSANTLLVELDITISLNQPVPLTNQYTNRDFNAITIRCRTTNDVTFSFPSEELLQEIVLQFIKQDIFMNELQKFWKFAKDKLPESAFVEKTGEFEEHLHFKFVKSLLLMDSFNCLLIWRDKKFCCLQLPK